MKTFETEKHNIPEGATHYSDECDSYYFTWFKYEDGVPMFIGKDGKSWFSSMFKRKIKPIPTTEPKYRYEKVEFNKASEAVAAWEDGELFTNISHDTYSKIESAQDTLRYLYRLYRRVEISERDLFITEAHKATASLLVSDIELFGQLFDSGKFKLVD